MIAGQPYVLLDMGVDGQLPIGDRPNLTGLFGRSVTLDPRFLTSYVRDVSLVTEDEYRRFRAPAAIRGIPVDLANVDLEYSGIYEDGWIGKRSYAVLSSGRSRILVVRADVAPRPGQHIDLFVDGRKALSRDVGPGALDLRLPLPASSGRRRVELRWAGAAPISARDRRSVSARLKFLGFAPAPVE